jgi:DNA-binding NarL/FixJ family response regulator
MKDIEKLEIILADDDFDDRSFFREAFKKIRPLGLLREFSNGKQVMDYLNLHQDAPPHLIFLDLNMPFKTGIQCLKEIRNNPAYKEVAIVIFTTSTSEFDIENCFDCGASLYMRKPFSYAEGIETLRRFFDHYDLEALKHTDKNTFYVE